MEFSDAKEARYAQERLRYKILEYVYLEAGEDTDAPVSLKEIEDQLSVPPLQMANAIDHLTLGCGYLEHPIGHGRKYTITRSGVSYIKTGARRRRSVRG